MGNRAPCTLFFSEWSEGITFCRMVMQLKLSSSSHREVRLIHCAEYWDDVSKRLLQYGIRGREKTSYLISEIAFGVFSPHSKKCFSLTEMWMWLPQGHLLWLFTSDPRVASTLRHSRVGVEAEIRSCQRLGPHLGKARGVIQNVCKLACKNRLSLFTTGSCLSANSVQSRFKLQCLLKAISYTGIERHGCQSPRGFQQHLSSRVMFRCLYSSFIPNTGC